MPTLTREQQKLVEQHVALVYFVSGRYSHIPEEAYKELVAKLKLRLCKAVQSFDPDRNIKISSYLVKSLEGEAKNYFRDDVWMVRPPRTVREKALSTEDEDEDEELTDQIRSCISPIPLDAQVSGVYGDYQLELPDGEESLEDQVVNRIGGTEIVKQVFNSLQPEERFILGCQMDGLSLQVIQDHFGLSPAIAKEVWEELKIKVRSLYSRALEDEPLPESSGSKALRKALLVRFTPPEGTFIDVRKRVSKEQDADHSPP